MRLIEAQQRIIQLGVPVVDVADASAVLALPRAHASKIMTRLAATGIFKSLTRGKWLIDPVLDPLVVAEHLSAPDLSYVSLQTALFFHGMISQIPETTYSVTTGRTQMIRSSVGLFSFHHIDAEFFFGYQTIGPRGIKMALAEKALIDFLYLKPARSRRFARLPELELPASFSMARATKMISKIRSPQRRTLVQNQLKLIASKKR